jgi:hypothetical protein
MQIEKSDKNVTRHWSCRTQLSREQPFFRHMSNPASWCSRNQKISGKKILWHGKNPAGFFKTQKFPAKKILRLKIFRLKKFKAGKFRAQKKTKSNFLIKYSLRLKKFSEFFFAG